MAADCRSNFPALSKSARYGEQVVSRWILPTAEFARLCRLISLGANLEARQIERAFADAVNLNNQLNVIDFAGLFSGNAIGPPRGSYSLRRQPAFSTSPSGHFCGGARISTQPFPVSENEASKTTTFTSVSTSSD
jgi:hypothetical protein